MRARAIALAGLTGCAVDPAPEVIIDQAPPCSALSVELRDADFLPGRQVLSIAGDGSDAGDAGPGGWVISRAGAITTLHRLGPGAPAAIDLTDRLYTSATRLVPGNTPGQTFLIDTDPADLKVARLDEAGIELESGNIDPFPSSPTSAWDRGVVFVGRRPYLFASPRSADDDTVIFWMADLGATLAPDTGWTFQFSIGCNHDPELCDQVSFSRIRVLDIADTDGLSPATILIEFQQDIAAGDLRDLFPGVLRVSISAETESPVAVLRTGFPGLGWQFADPYEAHIAPGSIALADAGYYLLAGLAVDELDPGEPIEHVVVRHDTLSASSWLVAHVEARDRAHLVPLGEHVGLGEFHAAGHWALLPLRGPEIDHDGEVVVDLGLAQHSWAIDGASGQVALNSNGRQVWVTAGCAARRSDRSRSPSPRARAMSTRAQIAAGQRP